jgi:hypothetical protein
MNRMKWKTLAFTYGFLATSLAVPVIAKADWPAYNLTPIYGTGSNATLALGINSYAQIGGSAYLPNSSTAFTGLYGGAGYASKVTTLPNGYASLNFTGINDSKYLVGSAMLGVHPAAVGCQLGGTVVDMTANLSVAQSVVCGVNHKGNAVGSYNLYTGVDHVFRWSSVTNTRTADWTGYLPGGINENDVVVASNLKPVNYFNQAELDFFPTTGSPTKILAPADYLYIYPNGISTYGGVTAIGQAALTQQTNSGSHLDSWAYNQAANQWEVLDAPGNPFYSTQAMAVDVWGERIVGSYIDGNDYQHAMVWQYVNGQWVAKLLSDLVAPDPDWIYIQATGINTYGSISGFGQHFEHGTWVGRGFVLTPKIEFVLQLPEGGIFGGQIVNPNLHVNGLNPFDVNFQLTTDTGDVQVPRLVDMPGMTANAKFTMGTQGVDTETRADVTAQLGSLTYTQPVLLLPAVMQELTLRPSVDEPGGTGILNFRGAAGPSGIVVTLTSSDPQVIVPSTVTVPAGASMAGFRITLGRRARVGSTATITATCRNETLTQSFTVN